MTALITLDLETYYDNDYSLAKMTTEEYINDPRFECLIAGLRLPDGTHVTEDTSSLSDSQLTEFFKDHRVHEHGLLCQNTAFDASVLNWRYGVKAPLYLDTMLMARVALRPATGSTSLASIAEVLGIGRKGTEVINAKGKHRADFTDEEWERYKEYCELDVALTYTGANVMIAQIPEQEFKVMDMTLRWYIDPTLVLNKYTLQNALHEERAELQTFLKRTGLTMDELSSNKKFATFLEENGVEVPTKPSPTNPSKLIPALAKSDTGFQQLFKHDTDIIRHAAEARMKAKSRLKETRLERFQGIAERNNGKLPVPLLYSGAHTHRYSGWDQINLQNLPRDALREVIEAPDGHVIISADQGQIEARLNAYLSGQDDLVSDFRRGVDVYVGMAESLYEGEIDKARRHVGKATILGCGYQMGADRFYDYQSSMKLGLDRAFCQYVINTYRTKYWRIKENWNTAKQMLTNMTQGGTTDWGPLKVSAYTITLPSGMKLHYPELMFDGDQFRYKRWSRASRRMEWVKIFGGMLVENVCQALARELLTQQMLILSKKYRTVHQIHDEIWFVVPEDEADIAMQVMKRIMEISPEWMPDLPLRVEPCAAKSAGDLK